jgi:hypothetical protein
VLGDTSALSTMTQAGNTSSSALVSGDQLPPPSSP